MKSKALLAVFGLAVLVAPRWGTAQTAQLGDATIQDRLAKHAGLFKIGSPRWGRLEDMKLNAQGAIDYQRSVIYDYMSYDPPLTPAQELAQMAKGTDAVVSGITLKRYGVPGLCFEPHVRFLSSRPSGFVVLWRRQRWHV